MLNPLPALPSAEPPVEASIAWSRVLSPVVLLNQSIPCCQASTGSMEVDITSLRPGKMASDPSIQFKCQFTLREPPASNTLSRK